MQMMVVIIDGTQDEPAHTWVREDLPLVVISAGDPVALALWADEVSATHVAVLTRPDTRSSASLQVTIAAGRHPQIAFCLLQREGSLLALAASAMSAIEGHAEAPDALARLQSTLETTESGVWLKRVNKLRFPHPKFRQHVRSLLPGGRGYLAVMSPTSTVLPVAKAQAAIRPHPGYLVSETTPDGSAPGVLQEAFQSQVHSLPPVGSTAKRYGSEGLEYARLGHQDALPTRPCPLCWLRFAGTACPYCRALPDHTFQEIA